MQTAKISGDFNNSRFSDRQPQWIDPLLQSRRIRVTVSHLGVAFVIDVHEQVLIGRRLTDGRSNIDLEPFQGNERGVSRQHMLLRREANRLVAIDKNSLNRSWLNGEMMIPDQAYPIYHNDRLRLGALQLQIEYIPDYELISR